MGDIIAIGIIIVVVGATICQARRPIDDDDPAKSRARQKEHRRQRYEGRRKAKDEEARRIEQGEDRPTYDRSINNLITYAMMSYLPIFCLVLFTPIRELEDDITYDLGVKDEKTS